MITLIYSSHGPRRMAISSPQENRIALADSPRAVTPFPFRVIDNFLTERECEYVLSKRHLAEHPAVLATPVPGYRTNTSSDLGTLRDFGIWAITWRMALEVGLPMSWSEGLQGQHYETGQEYKEHTDGFWHGTHDDDLMGARFGKRTWTIMVYLNTVLRGGGTQFKYLGRIIRPILGRAVIWYNLTLEGEVNLATMHAALPVEEGTKHCCTLWFRDREYAFSNRPVDSDGVAG